MATTKSITLAVANEGERNFDIELVRGWEPKKISYMGSTVFFEYDGTFYSMNTIDFKQLFNK